MTQPPTRRSTHLALMSNTLQWHSASRQFQEKSVFSTEIVDLRMP
jgi:hypothetical protein